MDNYEDIYKKICRVCLKISKSEKMAPLLDNTDSTGLSCFGKAIPTFAQVSYKKDEKLPTNVCQKCIYLLKQAIHFKFTCESSEKWLKNFLELSLKNSLTDLKIQENICQYIMYRHYFPYKRVTNTLSKRKSLKKSIPSSANQTLSDIVDEKIEKHSNFENDERLSMFDNDSLDFSDNFSDKSSQKSSKTISKSTQKSCKQDNVEIISIMKNVIKNKENKQRNKLHSITKQRDIPCKICNKILANPFTYKQHMERHGVCRYVCDKCGKSFPVLGELHIHQISRHGIGPYLQCDHCKYKAPTKLKLKEHVRLHTGERPFTCDKCGLTFRRQALWRNHQVVHMEKQIQCKICPQKFYRVNHMLAHMNNIHERKYVFMCSVCEVTYARAQTVRRHMMSKHGIKRELQGKIRRINKSSNCFPEK